MADTRLAICASRTGFICFVGEKGEDAGSVLLRFAKHLDETTVGYIGIELERHWVDRKLTGYFYASFDTDPEPSSERFWIEPLSDAFHWDGRPPLVVGAMRCVS